MLMYFLDERLINRESNVFFNCKMLFRKEILSFFIHSTKILSSLKESPRAERGFYRHSQMYQIQMKSVH